MIDEVPWAGREPLPPAPPLWAWYCECCLCPAIVVGPSPPTLLFTLSSTEGWLLVAGTPPEATP